VYLTGRLLCHQLPERSFFLWGAQMPVCARCTGIYAGAAVAAIVASSLAAPKHGRREGGSAAKLALLGAALPTLATLVYEWTTGQTPANWIRASAGVPIGVVVAWIVCRLDLSPSGDEVN
jgi:uncharacterized membrane protein